MGGFKEELLEIADNSNTDFADCLLDMQRSEAAGQAESIYGEVLHLIDRMKYYNEPVKKEQLEKLADSLRGLVRVLE